MLVTNDIRCVNANNSLLSIGMLLLNALGSVFIEYDIWNDRCNRSRRRVEKGGKSNHEFGLLCHQRYFVKCHTLKNIHSYRISHRKFTSKGLWLVNGYWKHIGDLPEQIIALQLVDSIMLIWWNCTTIRHRWCIFSMKMSLGQRLQRWYSIFHCSLNKWWNSSILSTKFGI